MLRRIQETEGLFAECAQIAEARGLHERTTGALAEAAFGFRVRNASYRLLVDTTYGEQVSELTASRDLRAIVTAGLFQPIGEKRGRYYVAEPVLTDVYKQIRKGRAPKDLGDPYELADRQLQMSVG
jgi:hypothetical protein